MSGRLATRKAWPMPPRRGKQKRYPVISGRQLRAGMRQSIPSSSIESCADVKCTQPDSALMAIAIGFSLVPAALIVLSLAWLRRYSLDAEQVAAAHEVIG